MERAAIWDDTASRVPRPAVRDDDIDYEDFFENGGIPLHVVGADGTILRANGAELELLGYAEDEYVGRPIADFHVDADVISDILVRLTRGENLKKRPARLRARDGSVKDVEITSSGQFRNGEFIIRAALRSMSPSSSARKRSRRSRTPSCARYWMRCRQLFT